MINRDPMHLGEWYVEPRLNRISRDGQTQRAEPKVMAVLCCLATSPGEPVTKEALVQTVWNDLSVAEGALKHLIWETRKLLGDDAKNPRYLETIPKVGYRLIAPVTWESPPKGRSGYDSRKLLAYGAVCFLILIFPLLMFLIWNRSGPALASGKNQTRMKGMPITSFHGLEIDPALSPDGRFVAFSRKQGTSNGFDLFVQEIGAGQPQKITDFPGDEVRAQWSPDGDFLAYRYVAHQPSESGIDILSLETNQPQRLPLPASVRIEDLDWSPLGGQLAVSARHNFWGPKQITLFDLSHERLEVVTQSENPYQGDESPAFSPDGKKLAFIRNWSDWSGDIFVVDLETKRERRLTFDHTLILGVTWHADGQSIIFSSDRLPPRALWRVPVKGGTPIWMPVVTKQPHNPTTARSSTGLVFQEVSCDPNLWRIDTQNGEQRPYSDLADSTQAEYQPQVAPDGSQIAFISERSGSSEIWLLDKGDSSLTKITNLQGPYIASLQWSPNGEVILFDAREANRSSLFLLKLADRTLTQPLPSDRDRLLPAWSRDGESFYFTAPANGSLQIWKFDSVTGRAAPLTQHGGIMAREHWTTGDIYFTKRKEPGLWRIPAGGTAPALALDDLLPADSQNWTLTDSGIYYVRTGDLGAELAFYQFEALTRHTICPLSFVSPYPGIGAAHDGTAVFFSKVESYESDLVLIPDTSKDD